MQDMVELRDAIKKSREGKTSLPLNLLNVFENMAYIMAKHADPELEASSVEEWLDGFSSFSIYAIFPQLLSLWQENIATFAQAKKKLGQLTGK